MEELASIVNELRKHSEEKEWFEFKENWFEPKELGEYISALSNSAAYEGIDNGYFIWGINDKTHKVTGTTFNSDQSIKGEPLKHYLARQIQPNLNIRFHELAIDGKKVVVLVIPAANTVPTSFNEERFIKIGSSKAKIKKFPILESALFSVLRNGVPTIENTESETQDLTFEKLQIYYGAKGIKLNSQNFMKNLGFFTPEGKYNMMAQLLSDNSHMPIRVAIFSGTSKADNLFAVREFGNQCLLYSLDEVLRYGDVLNLIQADERDRVVERKEVPLFDNEAFREAIINAFLHNKWVDGNEPMITVYSDRIEILSRGTLPNKQTIEGFFSGESISVNKKLSEIFLQLHISEKTGRGVPKIVDKYGKDAFIFRANSIVVKIPFNWINIMGEKGSKRENKPTVVCESIKLNTTQKKILSEIDQDPSITQEQLAAKIGLSKPAIEKSIRALKFRGALKRVGANKNGYWEIIVEDGAFLI